MRKIEFLNLFVKQFFFNLQTNENAKVFAENLKMKNPVFAVFFIDQAVAEYPVDNGFF